MARNVDFADKARVEGIEPRHRIEPEIEGRNLDIVDIEQQATAAAPAKLVQEIDLAPIVAGIDQVTRGDFDQNRPKQPVLHAADVGCQMDAGCTAVRGRTKAGKLIIGYVASS